MSPDPSTAPENMPDGDWRAAFGSLRTEVASLEAEVRGIGNQTAAALTAIERVATKVDQIGTAQAVSQNSTGRISAQLILGMIAVITPIVIAAAALGHVFVRSGDSHLESRVDEARSVANNSTAQIAALTAAQSNFLQAYAETRWSSEEHDRYHSATVAPLIDHVTDNRVEIARLQEQLKALTASIPSRTSVPSSSPFIIPLNP